MVLRPSLSLSIRTSHPTPCPVVTIYECFTLVGTPWEGQGKRKLGGDDAPARTLAGIPTLTDARPHPAPGRGP